jgi:Zn-dependent protease with chaperone function
MADKTIDPARITTPAVQGGREGVRDDNEGFFANLFSTHPPLGKRIARLQAKLGNAGATTIAGAAAIDT